MTRLMITLGAPFYRHAGALYVERQSVKGLHGWNRHFDQVAACSIVRDAPPPVDYDSALALGLTAPAFDLIALPDGFHLPTYLRERRAVRARLLAAMRQSDYVSFAIGGWIGDWGVEGAGLARRHGIAHAVWFDRVESQVVRAVAGEGLKSRLRSAIIARAERRVLAGADLALLHGQTVLQALGPLTRNPHLVEDVLIEDSDHIPADALTAKQAALAAGPLRIAYAGRAHPMKGGLDWVEVLGLLAAQGTDFTAAWAGEGDQAPAMQARIAELGLSDRVRMHPFIADRGQVLAFLRAAHVLLFCHMTDESPRILIESLHSGTPLAGYGDPFARGLADEQGAGRLVARGDRVGLAAALAALAADRTQLADLVDRADRSARHLTLSQVYAHRSAIIKSQLNPKGGKPHG